jgi:hypothetical protein
MITQNLRQIRRAVDAFSGAIRRREASTRRGGATPIGVVKLPRAVGYGPIAVRHQLLLLLIGIIIMMII